MICVGSMEIEEKNWANWIKPSEQCFDVNKLNFPIFYNLKKVAVNGN